MKVVDYKTGNVKLSLEEVYFGLQLQLILYLDSVLQSEQKKHPGKDVQPAGMLYFYVQDPQLEVTGTEDEIEYEQKLLAEYACDGYVNESSEILDPWREWGTQYAERFAVLSGQNQERRGFCGDD